MINKDYELAMDPGVSYMSISSSAGGYRPEFQLGQRVVIDNRNEGVLRFYGPVEFQPGLWAGVELDNGSGKNNGSVKGIRYFSCKDNHGIFVSSGRVAHSRDEYSSVLVTPTRIPNIEYEASLRLIHDHSLSLTDLHVGKENVEPGVGEEAETRRVEHAREMDEMTRKHEAEMEDNSRRFEEMRVEMERTRARCEDLERENRELSEQVEACRQQMMARDETGSTEGLIRQLRQKAAQSESEKLYGFTVLSYIYQSLSSSLVGYVRGLAVPDTRAKEIKTLDERILSVSRLIKSKKDELLGLFEPDLPASESTCP